MNKNLKIFVVQFLFRACLRYVGSTTLCKFTWLSDENVRWAARIIRQVLFNTTVYKKILSITDNNSKMYLCVCYKKCWERFSFWIFVLEISSTLNYQKFNCFQRIPITAIFLFKINYEVPPLDKNKKILIFSYGKFFIY